MAQKPPLRVLFQGDSITDAQRNRELFDELGRGYAKMAAGTLGAGPDGMRFECINRGISGNRIPNLQARWQEDCIALKPNWLSILIGINDCWRRYDRDDPTSTEDFHRGYRALLEETREKLPETRILLCEPFVLPFPNDRIAWREDLDPKINVVRELAREFAVDLVPFDGLFNARIDAPPEYWAPDGVHPTTAGHGLMAQAWVDTFRAALARTDASA